jgi:hypothetical protein
MQLHKLKFPVAYYDGKAYFMEPNDSFSWTHFGGPGEMDFIGAGSDSLSLHHILTLHADVIPGLTYPFSEVPLFYGMQYDGCELSYRVLNSTQCKILKLYPREAEADLPYSDYPRLLPYIPLRVAKRTKCTAKQFAKLAWQGLDLKPKTLAVIVPPIYTCGVSMWGKWGDAEAVQIIFECDLEKKTIKASNQCT